MIRSKKHLEKILRRPHQELKEIASQIERYYNDFKSSEIGLVFNP